MSHIFTLFIEFFEKNSFCPKKGVSGVPYLKIGTWEFYEMHIKFKHLGPLVMWNCQNPWKWKWPLFRTVCGIQPGSNFLVELVCTTAASKVFEVHRSILRYVTLHKLPRARRQSITLTVSKVNSCSAALDWFPLWALVVMFLSSCSLGLIWPQEQTQAHRHNLNTNYHWSLHLPMNEVFRARVHDALQEMKGK